MDRKGCILCIKSSTQPVYIHIESANFNPPSPHLGTHLKITELEAALPGASPSHSCPQGEVFIYLSAVIAVPCFF